MSVSEKSGFRFKLFVHILSAVSLLLCAAFCIYCWKQGAFSSQEQLQNFVAGYGAAAALIFMLIQVIQVVIPILPGGVSCLAGVVLFGKLAGVIYNYIGICIGSIIAYFLTRYYGKPLLYKMFKPEKLRKYEELTGSGNKFTILFALLIFSPIAPDDMLCFLAGTTSMKPGTFIAIILLCKPFAIASYSLGMNAVFQFLISGVTR